MGSKRLASEIVDCLISYGMMTVNDLQEELHEPNYVQVHRELVWLERQRQVQRYGTQASSNGRPATLWGMSGRRVKRI